MRQTIEKSTEEGVISSLPSQCLNNKGELTHTRLNMRVNNDMQMNSFGIDTLTIQLADFTLADRPDLNVEQARVELSTE